MGGHVVSARRRGLTDTEIDALDEPTPWTDVFDEPTVAALRLADAMCGDSDAIETSLTTELRRHFTEIELAELILVCGQANLNNRAGNAAKQLLGEAAERPTDEAAGHHWDTVYRTRPSEELGWYEPVPSTLGFVTQHLTPDESVIDVGGGDSRLVESLLDLGYQDLTVLDISEVAITTLRDRLGGRADSVSWINADVTGFGPTRTWDLWHDRAVFHFLVDEADRQAYKAGALRALPPGSRMVVAVFAVDGPEMCAGLPVLRYDADTLATVFAPEFDLVEADRVVASHDAGDRRPYVVAMFARRFEPDHGSTQ